VGPRAGLEDLKKRKISLLTGNESLEVLRDCTEACGTPAITQDAGQEQML